jgi:hypothetical protein
MMSKVDFFGHFFYASLFLGMLLLSAKDFRGWAFRFAGEVGWIGIGLVMGMSSIVVWGLAFMVVDVLGYLQWQAEHETLAMEERLESREEQKRPLPPAELLGALQDVVHTNIGMSRPAKSVKVKNNAKQKLPRRVRPPASKPKAKAKRNPPRQRKTEGKKVAAKRSRPTNRKVRAGGRRSRK